MRFVQAGARICLVGVLWAGIALGASPRGTGQAAAPAGQQAAQAKPPASSPTTPEERPFKNIQVLTGDSHTQVLEGMQYITVALGGECDFCHNRQDYSSDEKKEKQTARKMMTMMFAIDKDNFNGRTEVSCYTCHQGHNSPRGAALPPSGEKSESGLGPTMLQAKQIEPPAGTPIPSVEAILAKFKTAVGGAAPPASLMLEVDRSLGEANPPVTVQIYEKEPDKILTVLHRDQGTLSIGFDGTTAWASTPRGEREISRIQALVVKREGPLYPADLEAYGSKRLLAMVQVGDRKAYLVRGVARDGNAEDLYFDTDSGLLFRRAIVFRTIFGPLYFAVEYSDYRNQGGTEIAFHRDWWAGGQGWSETVRSVQANAPVTDAQFAPPAPVQPAPAPPGNGR